jgi:hypothetical protein
VDRDTVTQKEYLDARGRNGAVNGSVSYVPKFVLYTAALGVELLGRLLKRQVPLSRYKIQSLAPIAPFDCSAAEQRLGWTPSVGTREGLRRTFPAVGASTTAASLRSAALPVRASLEE